MTDETYNGWKNYPTWAVNLWLSNDRGLYEASLEIAREEIADAPACLNVRRNIWTVEQATRFNLADHYREWIEEMSADGSSALCAEPTMFDDLMGWALEQVDWFEIADAWLEDVAEVPA